MTVCAVGAELFRAGVMKLIVSTTTIYWNI